MLLYNIFKYETKRPTLLLAELLAVSWVPCILKHHIYIYIDRERERERERKRVGESFYWSLSIELILKIATMF